MRPHKVLSTTIDLDHVLAITDINVHDGEPNKYFPRGQFQVTMMFRDKNLNFEVWDPCTIKPGTDIDDYRSEWIPKKAADKQIDELKAAHASLLAAWQDS